MMERREKRYVEKRQGPDFWVKFVKVATLLVWGVMFIIILIIDRAKPEVENFFSHLFHVQLHQSWDIYLLTYAFYLSVVLFVFSIISLMVNMKRHRRKDDKYSKSLIAMPLFSLAVILFYLTRI